MTIKVLDPFRCSYGYDQILFHSEDDINDVTTISIAEWVGLNRPGIVNVVKRGRKETVELP